MTNKKYKLLSTKICFPLENQINILDISENKEMFVVAGSISMKMFNGIVNGEEYSWIVDSIISDYNVSRKKVLKDLDDFILSLIEKNIILHCDSPSC